MTMTFKITDKHIGKFMKLRSGLKAYIACKIPEFIEADDGFVGYKQYDDVDGNQEWEISEITWKENGRFLLLGEDEDDIVGEWEESKCWGESFKRLMAKNFSSLTSSDISLIAIIQAHLSEIVEKISDLECKIKDEA